jgi:large subunit ribosomal protein L9
MAETIGKKASERRAVLNNELKGVADILQGLEIRFPVKAGETGKLYGSVSAQMIIEKLQEMKDIEVLRHQLVMEPIRKLGEYDIPVNLTLDLVPEIKVIVHREGEVRKVVVAEPLLETVETVTEESCSRGNPSRRYN